MREQRWGISVRPNDFRAVVFGLPLLPAEASRVAQAHIPRTTRTVSGARLGYPLVALVGIVVLSALCRFWRLLVLAPRPFHSAEPAFPASLRAVPQGHVALTSLDAHTPLLRGLRLAMAGSHTRPHFPPLPAPSALRGPRQTKNLVTPSPYANIALAVSPATLTQPITYAIPTPLLAGPSSNWARLCLSWETTARRLQWDTQSPITATPLTPTNPRPHIVAASARRAPKAALRLPGATPLPTPTHHLAPRAVIVALGTRSSIKCQITVGARHGAQSQSS